MSAGEDLFTSLSMVIAMAVATLILKAEGAAPFPALCALLLVGAAFWWRGHAIGVSE